MTAFRVSHFRRRCSERNYLAHLSSPCMVEFHMRYSLAVTEKSRLSKVRPASRPTGHPRRAGLTLVELLVVIAIIGALVGLILPAVEMARESARRSSCANNLRQLGVAAKLHLTAQEIFPTGGWGSEWMGDPDAGFGPKQPGGWIYNLLPYLEQQALRDGGKGQPNPQKEAALAIVMATPLDLFACPSRRLPRAYPFVGDSKLRNATAPKSAAKSDYAVSKTISFEKSEVIASDVQLRGKGMSQTVLAGEKSVAAAHYQDGTSSGDQLAMYLGDCSDVARDVKDSRTNDGSAGSGFGSAHPSGVNFVYCDGSVRFVASDEPLE